MTTGFAASTGPDAHLPGKHDQSSHGRGKGGMRRSLLRAKTPEEVAAVVAAEASRIVGDAVAVDFTGADVDVARDFGEGILRGVEAYPAAALRQVGTYGAGTAAHDHNGRLLQQDAHSAGAYAVAIRGGETNGAGGTYSAVDATLPNGHHTSGTAVYLNVTHLNASVVSSGTLVRDGTPGPYGPRFSVSTTVRGIALHEFGHAIGKFGRPHLPEHAVQEAAKRQAATAGVSTSDYVSTGVSRYAATDSAELTAEVFADVMNNGSKATKTSKELFKVFDVNARGWETLVSATTHTRLLAAYESDLSQLQAAFETNLDALLRRWTDITASQRAQIVDQVRVAVTSDDLNALASITASTSEAAQVLTEAMSQMALDAAREMSREAMDQGVRIDPVASDSATFAATAVALSALLAQGLTNAAGREALRRWSPATGGDEVSAAVREHLESLSGAFVEANLSGALMSALTAGRMETALAGPSAALYASEQMDKNTCAPCRKINGKWIGNSDDPDISTKVQAVYPNGGYRDCLGGVRCRGTVVSVYRPQQVAGGSP